MRSHDAENLIPGNTHIHCMGSTFLVSQLAPGLDFNLVLGFVVLGHMRVWCLIGVISAMCTDSPS